MSGATFAPNCRRPRPLTYAVFNIFIVMALVTSEQQWGRKSVVAKYLKLFYKIFRSITTRSWRIPHPIFCIGNVGIDANYFGHNILFSNVIIKKKHKLDMVSKFAYVT